MDVKTRMGRERPEPRRNARQCLQPVRDAGCSAAAWPRAVGRVAQPEMTSMTLLP